MSTQVTVGANVCEYLELNFTAEEDGFVQVLVANESQTDTWFDDLEITYTPGLIVQENHYDPWGLNLAGIEREGDYPFQFNSGSEKQKDALGKGYFYETDFRGYDPQLGRFRGVDILADMMPGITPYQFAYNNPVSFSDPSGAIPAPIVGALIGAGVGGTIGGVISSSNGDGFWGGFMVGATLGAGVGAGIGYGIEHWGAGSAVGTNGYIDGPLRELGEGVGRKVGEGVAGAGTAGSGGGTVGGGAVGGGSNFTGYYLGRIGLNLGKDLAVSGAVEGFGPATASAAGPGIGFYEMIRQKREYAKTIQNPVLRFLYELTIPSGYGDALGTDMFSFGLENISRKVGAKALQKAAPTALKKVLPAWKTVKIEIEHIISGHMKGGSRALQSGNKSMFPDHMNKEQIERAVREAYQNVFKKIKTQGERVLLHGKTNDGLVIEMYLNTATKTIETAYPIGL